MYQYLEMEDGSLIRLGNFVKVSESDNEHDATTTSSNPSNINEEDKAELDYDDDEIEDASGTEDGYEYVEDSNEFIDLYEDEYSYYSTTTSVATTAEIEGSGQFLIVTREWSVKWGDFSELSMFTIQSKFAGNDSQDATSLLSIFPFVFV